MVAIDEQQIDLPAPQQLFDFRMRPGRVRISIQRNDLDSVPLSEWLLIFSIFIFTSLALTKRYAELAISREASAMVSFSTATGWISGSGKLPSSRTGMG